MTGMVCAAWVLCPAPRAWAQQVAAEESGTAAFTYRSGIYISTADRLPFWFYANTLGKVHPRGTNFVNTFTLRDTLASGDGYAFSAGGTMLARLSGRHSLHLPELYLQADHGAFRLQAGRFAQPIGTNNHALSVGSMMESTNATPVPRLTLSTPGFIDIPGLGGFLQFRGLFSHGWFPDNRFVEDVKLHQKFFYLRFNVENFSGTGGIVHNSTWGGNHPRAGRLPGSFSDYLGVVTGLGSSPGGDNPENVYHSVVGNSLAAYEFHALYRFERFRLSVTRLFYLEDLVSTRFRSPWDGVWGVNLQREGRHLLAALTYEHVNTKQQDSLPHEPLGSQNYYGNFIYKSGWTHEDRVLGIPLITFDAAADATSNNIIVAHHLGGRGHLGGSLTWNGKVTYSRNYTTFERRRIEPGEDRFLPLREVREDNLSLYLNLSYDVPKRKGLTLQLAAGADVGEFYRETFGLMAGVRWDGSF